MAEHFEKVKGYLADLGYTVQQENLEEELVLISDEDQGIYNLIIDCEDPILVLEQVIMDIPKDNGELFKMLLQMNRTLIHGAFVLDEAAEVVLFRDTLQLENLDRNELEASIHALSLALAENSSELLEYARR